MSRREKRIEYRRKVREYTAAHTPAGANIFNKQRDHIIPIEFGFNNDIPAKLIGGYDNVEWLTADENIEKGTRLTPKGIALLRKWGYHAIAENREAKIKTGARHGI